MLFNIKWTICQLYHDEPKLQLDETISALYTRHTRIVGFLLCSLKQQSTDRHVVPHEHIILVPRKSFFFYFTLRFFHFSQKKKKKNASFTVFEPTMDRTHDLPYSRAWMGDCNSAIFHLYHGYNWILNDIVLQICPQYIKKTCILLFCHFVDSYYFRLHISNNFIFEQVYLLQKFYEVYIIILSS